MLPLSDMLSGPKGPLELIGEALAAFERIENSLADAALLTPPAPEAQLYLMVDASTVALGMNKDVKVWTRSFLSCQRNEVQRHNKSPSGTFPSPDARFSHVHLDVVGPFPPSSGFTHLLTCVDRYTRWAEAIPLSNAQAETIVKDFVSRWVAMFTAPSTVSTDRGAQFESALFQTLLNFLGCTRIRTTA
nr:unnamed protein product [Spirometra erinaceieuropaei]